MPWMRFSCPLFGISCLLNPPNYNYFQLLTSTCTIVDKIGMVPVINLNTLRVEPPFALPESHQAFEVAKA